MRPNKPKHVSLEPRKVYCKETGGTCPQNCELLKDFSKALLKIQGERRAFLVVATSWCRNLLFLLLPVHIGQVTVPVNLQQDKCYSLLCIFLSLYEWTPTGQSPKNRLPCIFQPTGNILFFTKDATSLSIGNNAQRLK